MDRNYLAGVCVAAALLMTGSCGSEPAPGLALRGFVDLPKPGQTLTGKFVAIGWAVSADGIKRISASIDRKFPIDCVYGGSRPDVNKLVPGFPSGDNSGWSCEIDASTLPVGNHEIAFQSESNKGEVKSVGIVPVVIAH